MHSAESAEHEVDRHRSDLEQTLSSLRNNLKPSHLAREALAGGLWFRRVQSFAQNSPVSWAIMTAAAVGVGFQTFKRTVR